MKAAGILFLAPDNTALFLQRGKGGDHVGEWCFPGGKLEEDETLEQCAVREAKEECGKIPSGARRLWTRQVSLPPVAAPVAPGDLGAVAAPVVEEVDFTTFVQMVQEPFTPVLSEEHTAYCWAPIDQPPQPLHTGCAVAFDRLTMDELGVAKAMRDGRLTSPQVYENVTLFAIRITGTGYAYRRAHKEFVWRDPSLYLTDEFLQRCNGLQVIFDHPDGSMLNSKEFAQRSVGSIMLPYIVGNEVWGIAKIYDDKAIRLMIENQLSTSPAVVFRDPDVNVKLELESGEKLLIEGKPSVLDHVAICKQGVWDKGGEPAGVLTTGDVTLTDEERKAAEAKAKADAEAKVRADAEAGQKLDQLLSGIKALSTRFDYVESRLDAFEASAKKDGEEEKKEEARKDRFSKRKDGEGDEEYKARHDADETSEREEMEGKGEAKEVAADKAKKRRADAEAAEMKDRKDADAKKDEGSEREEMAERMKKEQERKDADAATAKQLRDLEARIPKPMTDADYRSRVTVQAKADGVFQAFGDAAPRPLDGETPLSYRRRLATQLKAHSTRWGKVDLSAFADEAAFGIAEEQIYADAMEVALNPKDLPEGQLRSVVRKDSTGREITSFYGEPQAWMQSFTSHRRRLSGIRNRVH